MDAREFTVGDKRIRAQVAVLTRDDERGCVLAIDDALIEIRDGRISGTVAAIQAEDSSIINVFGGDFVGDFFAIGGTFNIFGSDLAIDGTRLTGVLQDGTGIDLQAIASDGGRFVLTSIMELFCDFDGDGICGTHKRPAAKC